MKIFIVLCVLLSPALCFADSIDNVLPWKHDLWTTTDTVLQITAITLFTIDALQTYNCLYNDTGYHETNPVLGSNPSKKKFFIFNIGWVLIHTGIAYAMPNPFRTIWQSVWIADEIFCIYHNYSAGIRIKF